MEANQYQNHSLQLVRQTLRFFAHALCLGLAILVFAHTAAAEDPTDEQVDDAFAKIDDAFHDQASFTDPEAAQFDQWETIVEPEERLHWNHHELKPIDWIRHIGFRHSSTHGRHIGKGLPLEGTSMLNRPYHFDWFVGPLLGDDLINGRVSQGNVLFGGFRLGWDFDYYWGVEWRFGWADPNANYAITDEVSVGDASYVVSDVDLVYYPWGDSKVRPYFLTGIGATQLDFSDENSVRYKSTLATIPLGGGIQFRQASWLLWRVEVLDNISFGDDNIATLHNVSITAGMELRLGARPRSYWPWRSSRKVW